MADCFVISPTTKILSIYKTKSNKLNSNTKKYWITFIFSLFISKKKQTYVAVAVVNSQYWMVNRIFPDQDCNRWTPCHRDRVLPSFHHHCKNKMWRKAKKKEQAHQFWDCKKAKMWIWYCLVSALKIFASLLSMYSIKAASWHWKSQYSKEKKH